jgi:hypothetical protein
VLLSPVLLIVIAKAWAGATDGDPADALEIEHNQWKDQVIAGGRWTFDGAHDGYNEFHATRIIQGGVRSGIAALRILFALV